MTTKFPLLISRNEVLYPHTSMKLEVGRDFSVNAVQDSKNRYDGYIVVVPQKDCDEDSPDSSDFIDVGCLAKLEVVESNLDGSLVITLHGQHRVKIVEPVFRDIAPDKRDSKAWYCEAPLIKDKISNYSKCKEAIEDFLSTKPPNIDFDLNEVKKIIALLKTNKPDVSLIVDTIAFHWPQLTIEDIKLKQSILQESSVIKRINLMRSMDLVDESIKHEINEQIAKQVTKNISKQQKEFYLREKLRVIKEELGDTSSKEAEISKFKSKLSKNKYPEHIKVRVKEEIQRLEYCSSYSNEATVIRAYLDWILSLPWVAVSKDETDLKKVQKILNEDHYGLDKIKDRILEFIAIQRKSQNSRGGIICFVGPPGVGKTSLARSIARALKKEFVKVSLGGLYDESEIRGHRKTYVASMPGRIIRALRQSKVKNPVFLLDEIDKISSSYHGDPVHALLEILDPKQNDRFNDHYIEEDFDLSKVMFIATANYEENIPEPLYNRMEIIYLRSYTEDEKLAIAKSHLIREVLKESGLSEDEFRFTDEAVSLIIQRYTKEAGVRTLKQALEKIARKFVKRQLLGDLKEQVITPVEVREYLEYELYDFTKRDENPLPGVVNGMAYTDAGGDLLPIEVNHTSGKGHLSLTGNLKDTMRESANVALAYVRANEEQFKLKDKQLDWNNIDINLHVPAGGVPKDGPSAGVTITTALISSFSGQAVSSKVAMTGEITLRGKVLPIGGLKEKVVSAVRGGVDTIFYPEENTRHLVDIPEDVRKKITLIPVKHYHEIYNHLFDAPLKVR